MIFKSVKIVALSSIALLLVGVFLFGGDLMSYVRSSTNSVRAAVKDNVPIEFELRRARDLLDDVIPEMQANIRLIAQEEVEVANLREDIERSQRNLAEEQARIEKLADMLSVHQASFTIGQRDYTRDQLKEDLQHRFERYREAEQVLAGKQRLLEARENALQAALTALDRTRSQKALLEEKIASLEGQHRLVVAASQTSGVHFDNSKLEQTERLIAQIRTRLDVAERVLAHQTAFTDTIPIDVVDEQDLLTQVHEHFAGEPAAVAQGQADESAVRQ